MEAYTILKKLNRAAGTLASRTALRKVSLILCNSSHLLALQTAYIFIYKRKSYRKESMVAIPAAKDAAAAAEAAAAVELGEWWPPPPTEGAEGAAAEG